MPPLRYIDDQEELPVFQKVKKRKRLRDYADITVPSDVAGRNLPNRRRRRASGRRGKSLRNGVPA